MKNDDLKRRTRDFSLAVVRLYAELPRTTEAQVLGRQMLRSATSVGAQYREAQRAKSDADFINKIEGALQEGEETLYWLELLAGAGIASPVTITPLATELDELIRIFVSMVCKVKARTRK